MSPPIIANDFLSFLTNLNQPTLEHDDGVGPKVSATIDFRDGLRLSSHFIQPPVRIDGIALSKFVNESSTGELVNASSLKEDQQAGKCEHRVQKAPASKRKRVKCASKAQLNAKIKQVKNEIKSLEQLKQLLERENKKISTREAVIASVWSSLHQQAVINQQQPGSLWARRRAEISKTHWQLLGSGNRPGNNCYRHHPDDAHSGGMRRLLHSIPTPPTHPFVSNRPNSINRGNGSLLHPIVSLALLASSQSKLTGQPFTANRHLANAIAKAMSATTTHTTHRDPRLFAFTGV